MTKDNLFSMFFCFIQADNGVVFIGPNSSAISAMGDKIESKRIVSNHQGPPLHLYSSQCIT